MRTVQLDKNAGSKKLRDACNEQGLVRCILLPRDVRDQSDEAVLQFAIRNGYLTLTFDRPLCIDSAHVFAGRNPGVLLLRTDDGSVQRMSTKTAPKVLEGFKADFPDWHILPWHNSIVELTPTLVQLYHTAAAPPVLVAVFKRAEPGWQDELIRLLNANAQMIAEDNP